MRQIYDSQTNHRAWPAQIVAALTATQLSTQHDQAHKGVSLEVNGGSVSDSYAAATLVARESSFAENLLGHGAFEEAKVAEWLVFAKSSLAQNADAIAGATFGTNFNAESYAKACNLTKDACKRLNQHLNGRLWLVDGRLTLADVVCFTELIYAFQFVLDAGFRKAMPNVSAWWERVSSQSAVLAVCGRFKMCEKPIKAQDPAKLPAVTEQPKQAEPVKASEPAKAATKQVEKPKATDDDFDPFADEEEEDGESLADQQARFDAIAAAAKKNAKKVVNKSLIVWDVKPWGEDTDLDEMAKLILEIQMEGLDWKTEYKKEPVAYGVFKIQIGATIVDDLVSTDEVQEKIEALEDYVQSVDIVTFQKI